MRELWQFSLFPAPQPVNNEPSLTGASDAPDRFGSRSRLQLLFRQMVIRKQKPWIVVVNLYMHHLYVRLWMGHNNSVIIQDGPSHFFMKKINKKWIYLIFFRIYIRLDYRYLHKYIKQLTIIHLHWLYNHSGA